MCNLRPLTIYLPHLFTFLSFDFFTLLVVRYAWALLFREDCVLTLEDAVASLLSWMFLWFCRLLHACALSGSHRSATHIASDLASRVLASQTNRSGSPNRRHFTSLDLKNQCRFFVSQANIAGFSQALFLAFSCDFRSSECVFASLAKTTFSHR